MAIELTPIYRFTLADRTSAATRSVNPVWKDDLALEYAREQSQMFFRTKMSGKLVFVGEDAEWIVNRGYSHEIGVTMERSNDMGDTWSTAWTGHFYMTDCEVNLDDSRITVQPTVDDDYNKILAAYDKEFNLVDLTPAMDYVHIQKFPMIQIYYPGESVLSCIYNGMSWEQDVDSETSDSVLTEDYHFARNSNEREITVIIGGSVYGVYEGNVSAAEFEPYQADFYPISGGGGTYLYVNYDLYTDQNTGIGMYVFTVEMRNGGTEQVLYSYEERGISSRDTSDMSFVMNEVGGSGTADCQISTRAIYARILLDVFTYDGYDTAPLSSADFCHDNRNYTRAIGFVLGARYLVTSAVTQVNPTEWGKAANGQYFVEPSASDDLYPIARTSWENTSVWFLNDDNFIGYMRSVGTKTMVLRTAYLLWSVIDVLVKAIDPTISHSNTTAYSEFFYSATNPVSNQANKTLLITPKSNILAGEFSQPATKAPVTLKNVMEMLRDVYDCYWHIEDHKLHIEHISWYKNGGSYSVAPSVGIDLTTMVMSRNGEKWSYHTDAYKYDKDQMPQTFQYGWMDEVTEAFMGKSIEVLSPYVDQGQIEETRVAMFTSDIDYLLLNPGEISKDGFALMAGTDHNGYYTLRVVELPNNWAPWVKKYLYLQNADLAFCILQPYYLCYNMPARSLMVNELAFTAYGVRRTKSQEVRVPSYEEPNPLELVKTGLGNGYVDKMTMVLTSRVAKTILKYEPE